MWIRSGGLGGGRRLCRLLNQQSLWSRGDDQTFEDYLKGFNANQRRNIKRERKAVAKAGITAAPQRRAVDLELLQTMHRFYEQHCACWGPWGSKYLEEGFFEALARLHRDQLVLFPPTAATRGSRGDVDVRAGRASALGPLLGQPRGDRLSHFRSVTTPRSNGLCSTASRVLIQGLAAATNAAGALWPVPTRACTAGISLRWIS